MSRRTIRRQYRAVRDNVGDLVTRRPLPNEELDQIDPFLFLNHHGPQVYPPGNRGLPFGPHPHRGFETVTFIVAGSLLHRDTGGHESVIGAGGVQWMTAGRGLEHAEVSPPEFLERGGPLEILQLWVNLPAKLKMVEPHYLGVQKEGIPEAALGGSRVHVISGEIGARVGPVSSLTGVHMSTVALSTGATVVLPAPRVRNVFLYVVRGKVRIEGEIGREVHLLDMNADGDEIAIEGLTDALLLFGHAEPLGEPVVAQGPFVMNTREEIIQAYRDYQAGKFGSVIESL
jgi:quercetin 2,3-dioxygenase